MKAKNDKNCKESKKYAINAKGAKNENSAINAKNANLQGKKRQES